MLISICVIAKNEADSIGVLIRNMATQTVFCQSDDFEFVVICNGCEDNTAEVAAGELEKAFVGTNVRSHIHDTPISGKARSWNLAVHEVLDPTADIIVFMDSDIQLKDNEVIADLISKLLANANTSAISGWPVKDAALKKHKSIIDRFSLQVSSQTPAPNSINGSLYVGRAGDFQKIWLPVPTAGEDGFLSAMIHTQGFTEPPMLDRIQRADRPTHYYETHTILGFVRHERRITVATTINGWIFERLWADDHSSHAGKLIKHWNENDPLWVSKLVSTKVVGRSWALPPRLLIWRLYNLRGVSFSTFCKRVPYSIAATMLNIWPAILANKAIKNEDVANIW